MVLIITPPSRLTAVIAGRSPSHIVALLGPGEMIETPAGVERDRHLRLELHDIAVPQRGLTAPAAEMVERRQAFGRGWDAGARWRRRRAGVSRSTASAFAIVCERNPDADDIPGRRGRMTAAVEAMGDNNYAAEGKPFDLPIRH